MSEETFRPQKIASEVQAKLCHNRRYIGIDFLNDDGEPYAHGHMDLGMAKQFHVFFNGLIKEMENKTKADVAIEAGVMSAIGRNRTMKIIGG